MKVRITKVPDKKQESRNARKWKHRYGGMINRYGSDNIRYAIQNVRERQKK